MKKIKLFIIFLGGIGFFQISLSSQLQICFTFDEKEQKITDYNAKLCGTNLDIPYKIKNKKVLIIGENSFKGKNISSVILPKTVKKIEKFSFFGNNIESIEIPDSLIYVGKYAFKKENSKKIVLGYTKNGKKEKEKLEGIGENKSFLKITDKKLTENTKNFETYVKNISEIAYFENRFLFGTEFQNLKFKDQKINKLINILDKLIEEKLKKRKIKDDEIIFFYENYNNFKISIGYIKHGNKKEGRKYAKMFLKNIVQYIK